MTRLAFYWILIIRSFSAESTRAPKLLVIAVNEVISRFYVENPVRFNIIIYGSDKKWCEDILSDIHKKGTFKGVSKILMMEPSNS